MDNGASKYKYPAKANGVTRSTVNNNFTLTSNGVNGRRYSSIETGGSSCSSDISSTSSNSSVGGGGVGGGEIRIRNSNRIHGHDINVANPNRGGRDQRWTVNSVDKIATKRYVTDKTGQHISPNLLANVNDTHNKFTVADKTKWTYKAPINGNFAM